MTNTPDKSEMRALERVERRLNNAWAKHGFMTLTVSDLREVVSLARAPSRPADQVADMVERVARAHSPETWATIDELRSTAAWYREKIGKVGYRDGSAEREAEFNQRLADEYANEQITRARAALGKDASDE